MDGRAIRLADGTEYPGGECGYAEKSLWCYFPAETNLSNVFLDFSNKDKTAKVTFLYGEMQDDYEGFTDFRGLMRDADEKIRALLLKE